MSKISFCRASNKISEASGLFVSNKIKPIPKEFDNLLISDINSSLRSISEATKYPSFDHDELETAFDYL